MTHEVISEPVVERGVRDRSILELILGVITSPSSTFDEILRRRLLVPGLAIAFLAGIMWAGVAAFNYYVRKEGSLFTLGWMNPAAVIGLTITHAWFIIVFGNLLGGNGNFSRTLTVLVWTSIFNIPVYIWQPISGPGAAVSMLASTWGLVVTIIGIGRAQEMTTGKTILTLIMAGFTTGIAMFLAQSMLGRTMYPAGFFATSTIEAARVCGSLVSSWLAVFALFLVVIFPPRFSGEQMVQGRGFLNSIAILAIIIAGLTTFYTVKVDPLGEIAKGVQAYDSTEPNPTEAARHFARSLAYFPSDSRVRTAYAQSLCAAGNYDLALKEYEKVKLMRRARLFKYRINVGIGTVRYLQGDYKNADISLAPSGPRFSHDMAGGTREALVQLRLGERSAAIQTAETDASDGFGDIGSLPYVVLAQAYTEVGNRQKASAAVQQLQKADPTLAARLATGPGGWKTAAFRLSPIDLRLPLPLPTSKNSWMTLMH